ncbi:DUF2158 domain-containing protein [Pseudomonas fluorescens]|uniref:DUF2158 domain-containing protein n=1 Tax=Pseudomonas fluorescens TaxID=294 RepID=UPI0028652C40|nr:hypothetical protein [Pseudomonas fluorescens]MDR6162339.1 uncharacterized protein YodC (DUF2158 family) [Pseudomonas fluorescens]
MSNKFSVGDVVRSEIGDHDMTVWDEGPIEVGGGAVGTKIIRGTMRADLVVCAWFAGKKLETKRFNVSELVLIRPAEQCEIREGNIVQLASGGPKMLVETSGPMEVGGFAMASPTRGLVKRAGSIREDLAGCKWENRTKTERKRFPVGVLKPV